MSSSSHQSGSRATQVARVASPVVWSERRHRPPQAGQTRESAVQRAPAADPDLVAARPAPARPRRGRRRWPRPGAHPASAGAPASPARAPDLVVARQLVTRQVGQDDDARARSRGPPTGATPRRPRGRAWGHPSRRAVPAMPAAVFAPSPLEPTGVAVQSATTVNAVIEVFPFVPLIKVTSRPDVRLLDRRGGCGLEDATCRSRCRNRREVGARSPRPHARGAGRAGRARHGRVGHRVDRGRRSAQRHDSHLEVPVMGSVIRPKTLLAT